MVLTPCSFFGRLCRVLQKCFVSDCIVLLTLLQDKDKKLSKYCSRVLRCQVVGVHPSINDCRMVFIIDLKYL